MTRTTMRALGGLAKTRTDRVQRRLAALGILAETWKFCTREGIPLMWVTSTARDAEIVRVRHRLWTVLIDTLGLSLSECAALFEVDHTTVMYAVRLRRIELEKESAA